MTSLIPRPGFHIYRILSWGKQDGSSDSSVHKHTHVCISHA